ncbi:3526_t:CDS:2 [Rhizophagus irregularis]|nr:3526_t:CDS:2 [Rhizophagus irregularis]
MAISLENNSDQTARTQIYQAHISCNENVLSAAQAPMKSPKASKALPRLSRLCKKLLKGKYEREEVIYSDHQIDCYEIFDLEPAPYAKKALEFMVD